MHRFGIALAVITAGAVGYALGGGRLAIPASAAARDQGNALLAIDRDFDQATSSKGLEGWMSYMAGDGIVMPDGQKMAVGEAAVRKTMAEAFTTPGFALRWEPVDGGSSGSLGYTCGLYKTTRPGPDGGPPVVSYGKYLTVWKKQGGQWKVAVDIGNSSPPPLK